MAMKVKKTEQVHVDEGEYKAVVADIQEKTGNWGKYYVWVFLVKGATDEGEKLPGKVKVTGLTSEVFSDGSKLCKWSKAAGIDVDEDEIDLDEAKKSLVRVYIEDDENKKDGRIFSKVSKVKPIKKSKKTVAEDDDEEDEEEEEKPKKKKKSKKEKKGKKNKKKAKADDDEDEKPKKKKKSKKKVEEEEEEEEEEEDESEEDEGDDEDEDEEEEEDEELFDFDDDEDDD